MTRARLLIAGALLSFGCAESLPPPTDPGPLFDRPSSVLPADLDVAIRLDLDGARRLFGVNVARSLELGVVDAKDDPATAALVTEAFAKAKTAWIALRPGLPARLTDNVLVLRGDFGAFDPSLDPKTRFGVPADLGAGWQSFSRPRPARRSAPARIYVKGGEWIVFVSEAEVDSTARVVERRQIDEHVEPPDRGLVALAARTEPLVPMVAARFPAVADTLRGASLVQASAAADDRGLKATLEVQFSEETDAEAAQGGMRKLLEILRASDGVFGILAKGADATVVGPSLVVRITLDARAFANFVGALSGTSSGA